VSSGPFRPCFRCAPHFERLEQNHQAADESLIQSAQGIMEQAIVRAVADERERCARLCNELQSKHLAQMGLVGGDMDPEEYPGLIRASAYGDAARQIREQK
jgi:methylphosphotriester-DNA--protein-cysteine methyltransferase